MQAVAYYADYSDLTEYIMSEPLVREAELAMVDGVLVIAVLTEPIFFKSEGDNLEKRIALFAAAAYPDIRITVTRNVKTFYELRAHNDKSSP